MPAARRFARVVLAALLLFAFAAPGHAQDWPAKTVRIIVPWGPGSTPDIVARMLADGLQKKYPNSAFVVENKPGSGGNLGTDVVAKAEPDGATLGISIGGPLAINALINSKLPYDPRTDIAPISQLVTQASALAVHPSLRVRSVKELLVWIRQNSGNYNYSSIGSGSLSQLTMLAIAQKAGATLVHVPYNSSPQAMTALVRNDVQMACLPLISVAPFADRGKAQILAVSTAQRSPFMPDVPTLKESGINVEADAWMGLIAPGGTSRMLVNWINEDVVAIINQPMVREKLATQMMEPVGSTPDELRAKIDGELTRWAPVIDAAAIKIN
jgi:tripartite-type tricarboxylate transporter receptor subunit TctC